MPMTRGLRSSITLLSTCHCSSPHNSACCPRPMLPAAALAERRVSKTPPCDVPPRAMRSTQDEAGGAFDAAPDHLEDAVVAGVVAAAAFLRSHDALQYLLRHEPDVVLPWVSFHRIGVLYDAVATFATPRLVRFIPDPVAAGRAAEWLARVVLSYVANPSDGNDLADPASARRLLATYVIPGLVLAVDALGVDLEQHVHRVPRPLSDLGRGHARVEPQRHGGVTQVVRPAS